MLSVGILCIVCCCLAKAMLFVGKAVNRRESVEILHFETREVQEQYYALPDILGLSNVSSLVKYKANLICHISSRSYLGCDKL